MKTKIIKEQITCPRCNGSGRVFDTEECIFTAGVSFVLGLIDDDFKDECPKCEGKGYIIKTTEIIEQ